MSRKLPGVLSLATLLTSSFTWGVDIVATVRHTSEHTTNTARTANNDIEEWIHRPGIDLGITHEGANLELNADYNFERRFYEKDLFDDENVTTGAAVLLWHALPQRLDFVVRNTRTESTQRARDVQTQNNRQEVTYTEAGSTLRLQPRSGDELQFEYLFTDVRAEETNTDSQRHTGTARYILRMSAARGITFESSFTDIDFDNPFAPDIESWRHSVTYRQTGANLQLSLTGGYNRFDRDLDRDTVDGGMFNVDLGWQRGASRLSLSGGQQLRDNSSRLTGATGFGEFIREDTDLNEAFTETLGRLTWSQSFGRTNLGLSVFASKEDYEDVARDSERVGVSLTLSRQLNRRTTMEARFAATNRKFDDQMQAFDEYNGSLRLTRELGRALNVSLGVVYEERNGDGDAGTDFREWIYSIGIAYTVLGAR